jgi:integrase
MKIYNTINLPGVSLKNHPNVHSFRHNFAIRALNKMEEAGMDLYHTLPILAVYLGHNGIRELEQYLWLSQSKHNEITQSSSNLIENLIPEVNWNEE